MKKKALALILSLTMLVSSVVPGLLVSANGTTTSDITTIEEVETPLSSEPDDETQPPEGGSTTNPTNPGEGGTEGGTTNPGEGGTEGGTTNPGEGGTTNPGEGGTEGGTTNPGEGEGGETDISAEELYNRFMACKTIEEIEALLEQLTEEQLNSLTEEQIAAIEAHINSLLPEGEPEIPLEPMEPSEPPVESEIVSIAETVDMTNVAPFLPPVGGVGPMRAMAANGNDGESSANDGMEFTKKAEWKDGQVEITMEAYATGEKTITPGQKDVPTDIVLVLDQSGSMKEDFDKISVSFKGYNNRTNEALYGLRHNGGNGNLWYKVDDENYASVSVERKETNPVYEDYSGQTNSTYNDNQNNLYLLSNDQYKKVDVSWKIIWDDGFKVEYTYRFDGGSVTSTGIDNHPDFSGYGTLVRKTGSDYAYTYSYTIGGEKTEIETSNGKDGHPTELYYERQEKVTGTISRLEALKEALNSFVAAVNTKALGKDGKLGTNDDINHRIAVVGFASNTEYYIGSESYRDESGYGQAFQDMSTQTGQSNVTNSINALYANGATRADLGLKMAQGILEANPVQGDEQRNRVVVFFTDGSPTDSNGFEIDVAEYAIKFATQIKGTGANVYSVGIFDGADATSEGTKPNSDLWQNSSKIPAASNWFMQNVSNNNGTPQDPSYYLSASDSNALNNIFKQIGDNIESGGTSVTLGSESVIKDVISDQFQLPEGASSNITLKVYDYIGQDTSNPNAWVETAADEVSARVDGKTVSVTGFNFAENYVGTVTTGDNVEYRGKKLVIKFNVEPKPDFLGGNNVPTNASAGIYANEGANDPTVSIDEQPTVNVPILQPTVTATDKNVYLMQGLTEEQLKEGVTVTLNAQDSEGEYITLDLSPEAKNYGLEDWQTEFVTIDVKLTDDEDQVVQPENLTEDQTYNVKVTISPNQIGTEEEKSGNGTVQIKVFKPEITWKDSQIDLGQTPNYQDQNFEKVEWKHQPKEGNPVPAPESMGTAPTLTYTFDPEADDFQQETNVKVTGVKVGETNVPEEKLSDCITFLHDDDACNFPGCPWKNEATQPKDAHFTIHIKSFDLTIKKTVEGEVLDNQTFVFTVQRNDSTDAPIEVVIKGENSKTIKGLPSGTYTVTEKTDWSWRYNAEGGNQQTVTPRGATAKVTFNNTLKSEQKWLNGYAYQANDFVTAAKNLVNTLLSMMK